MSSCERERDMEGEYSCDREVIKGGIVGDRIKDSHVREREIEGE